MKNQRINVIGAGLVGCIAALYFARQGYNVELFERRPDLRQQSVEPGRSINLALSHRGIRTLEELGLKKKVLATAVPVYGRCVHSETGKLDFQTYSHRSDEYNFSVSRELFNQFLLDEVAALKNVNIHFETNVSLEDLSEDSFVIAADGASSHLRRQLQAQDKVKFEELASEHAYKELLMKPRKGKQLDRNHLHIWPCHEFMLIALPNLDGSFTCTLFMSRENFSKLDTDSAISEFFTANFSDVIAFMPDYIEQFRSHPVSDLKTIQGAPWLVDDRVLFIGDAAHAMLPYLGQGLNCGFEDCRLLNQLLVDAGDVLLAAKEFAATRKQDTDAITELSLQNYLEMRHKVVDADYLAKRKKEEELAQKNPESFRTKYELISYTSTPYSEILNKL